MKTKLILLIMTICACNSVSAQVFFKTECFGMSSYRDSDNNKVGNSKGSAIVTQLGANIPLSVNTNERNQPTVWGIGVNGAYVSLNNKNFNHHLVLSEIYNANVSFIHSRPLNDKWSLMASVGIGLYAPKLSNLGFKNFLGSAGVLFTREIYPNLEVGIGLAINNTFGYPMIFPASYFSWIYDRKVVVNLSAFEGLEFSAGYNLTEFLFLGVIAEMNGQAAFVKKDGKDMIFSHQYNVFGGRAEIKFSKSFSLPITIGFHTERLAYYDKRTLSAFFKTLGRDYDPSFKMSPYLSIGLKYGF